MVFGAEFQTVLGQGTNKDKQINRPDNKDQERGQEQEQQLLYTSDTEHKGSRVLNQGKTGTRDGHFDLQIAE